MFCTRASLVSGKIINISFYISTCICTFAPIIFCRPMLLVGISLVDIADVLVQYIVIGPMFVHAYVLCFGISLVLYLLRPT
jgi:hypothetical protein